MIRVELKHLPKDEPHSALEYLRSKLGNLVSKKGGTVLVDAHAKEIKLVLGKFLHSNGIDDYRIVSSAGIVEVLPPKEKRRGPVGNRGTTASAPQTMPYYFPSAPILRPKDKKS